MKQVTPSDGLEWVGVGGEAVVTEPGSSGMASQRRRHWSGDLNGEAASM